MLKVKVGTKDKVVTTTGAEASPTTGLGFTPKVVIFWGSSSSAAGWTSANARSWFGVAAVNAAGTMSYGTCALGMTNAGAASIAGHHVSASGCLLWCNQAGTKVVRASINGDAFDSDGFTLNYATNNASAAKVNWMALGGESIEDAKVLNWTTPASNGSFSITGVGFRPDAMINFSSLIATAAVDTAYTGGTTSIGAVDKFMNQWSNIIWDKTGSNPTEAKSVQDTAYGLGAFSSFGLSELLTWTSFDADGFTATAASVGTAQQAFSLCLKGPGITVGSFAKSTTTAGLPITQGVTGVRRRPVGYLLSSCMQTSNATAAGLRLGIGATDNTNDAYAGVTDKDAVTPVLIENGWESAHVWDKNNNDDTTTEAQLDHSSLDNNGFTVSIPINDAVATVVYYVAFGSHFSDLPATGAGR